MKLRPVSFIYKDDPQGIRPYGLVAEEVERVYPELVAYRQDGKVETVRYSMLTPMLLNELQKRTRQIQDLADQVKTVDARLAKEGQLNALQREIDALKKREARIDELTERIAALEDRHEP